MSIIASDIDGVLADIGPEINRRVSKHFNIAEDYYKKDKWYMHERYGIDFDVMEEFLQKQCFDDPEFWLDAKPFRANIEALNHYSKFVKVVLITGRHGPTRDITTEWLGANRVKYDYLLMDSLHTKHKVMKYAGAEVMFEDRYQEAKVIAEKGFTSFLIRRDYNIEHEAANTIPGLYWINTIEEMKYYV